MLESLAALYRRGAAIDWRGVDRDYPRKKVELPAYPFERQRYALPKPREVSSRATSLRPLIDSAVQSPLIAQTLLTTQFGIGHYPFLLDHKIFGEIVAPAASYVAMLLNGVASLGQARCRLDDVYFVAPLVLSETADRTVQTVIEPDSVFQIVGFEPGSGRDDTVKHVTGRVSWDGGAAADSDRRPHSTRRASAARARSI
jgi:acyl transferase domain-containing protein